MALRDVTNVPPYKAQVTIDGKYAPLIQRGKFLHEQVSKSCFLEKRKAGLTTLDLWMDGSLYPNDPRIGKRPKLNCLKDLLEFVEEGENGMLGYVKSLESDSAGGYQRDMDRYIVEISFLKEHVSNLQSQINLQSSRLLDVPRLQSIIASLELQKTATKGRMQQIQLELIAQIVVRDDMRVVAIAAREDHVIDKNNLEEIHKAKLQSVRLDLYRTKATLSCLTQKMNRLQNNAFGYRSQIRQRRDLSSLSQKGGHAKFVRRLARRIVGPQTARVVHDRNMIEGRTERLHGDESAQAESSRVFASLLSRTEVSTLLQDPKMIPVGEKLVNRYFDKIEEIMGPENVFEICDRNSITQNGYAAYHKKFSSAVKVVGCGNLRVSCMANPHHVTLLRRDLNSRLEDYIGSHSHIENEFIIAQPAKSKTKVPTKVVLSSRNSFFVDIEKVQQTMVRLYKITPAGTILLFCYFEMGTY